MNQIPLTPAKVRVAEPVLIDPSGTARAGSVADVVNVEVLLVVLSVGLGEGVIKGVVKGVVGAP